MTYVDTQAPSQGYASTLTRTISFAANDGIELGSASTSTVGVTAVNSPPVNTTPVLVSVGQNGTVAFSAANLDAISVSDVDANGGQDQVTLSVTNGTLTLPETSGLTFTVGSGTANTTMTFTGTLPNINAALNGLVYQAPPLAGSQKLTITTNDSGGTGIGGPQTATNNVAINVSAVSPVVTLSVLAPAFTQGAAAVAIDPSLTVTDAGNPNLASATISIGSALPEDVLAFSPQNGISIASNTGGVLTLTGTATVAQYQTALESVTYADTSNDPNTTNRSISFVVSDGTLSSNSPIKTVSIVEVDQAPTISAPVTAQSVAQNSTLSFSTTNGNAISVADVDANGGVEQVTLSVSSGTLTLPENSGLTFTTGTGTGNQTMTFTGTLLDINTALNGLDYQAPLCLAAARSPLRSTIWAIRASAGPRPQQPPSRSVSRPWRQS